MMAADIIATTTSGQTAQLGWLDKEQAKRLYGISQQLEQEWREKRRVREMEEKRAAAGGIVMHAPTPAAVPAAAPAEDLVQKLGTAKTMLDQGLISEAECQEVKAKILASV